MTVTTITDFRANAKTYIDTIINDKGALLINRGCAAAVLISLEEYNSIKATQGVLQSSVVSEEVFMGIEQLNQNESVEVDIDML